MAHYIYSIMTQYDTVLRCNAHVAEKILLALTHVKGIEAYKMLYHAQDTNYTYHIRVTRKDGRELTKRQKEDITLIAETVMLVC